MRIFSRFATWIIFEVLFRGVLDQPRYMMERIDIIPDLVSKENIFD